MLQVLRPLTLGELLDRTVSLYRRHLFVFMGLVALPNLLVVVANILNAMALPRGGPPDVTRVLASFASTMTILLISMITIAISQAATMVAVSHVHLNRPLTIREAYAGIRGRMVELVLMTLGIAVIVFFSVFLLVLPAIYLTFRWSLTIPSAVIERLHFRSALARSGALAEGQYLRIFAIYALYIVLSTTFVTSYMAPVYAIMIARGLPLSEMPLWATIVGDVGGFLTQCAVGPLLTIALALSYYDARVRQEAFDLDYLLAQLEPIPAEPVAVAQAVV